MLRLCDSGALEDSCQGIRLRSPADRHHVDSQKQRTSIDRIALAPEPVARFRGATSPDGAITLMLSDIADAASVAQRIGPDRWEQLLRDHGRLVEQLVASYRGQVTKIDGDGFVASFHSAHASVLAAMELNRAFAEIGGDVDGASVALRIGLHSGFVIPNPDQPQGRNFVLAARIAGQARAGEILVSSSLKQYTERDRRFRFEPHGEYHFKGLVGEHTVYSVGPAVGPEAD
jgi:class 3 adenylate cyclase